MRIYCITDEISEQVINVFLAKSDKAAKKQLDLDLKNVNKQVEVKLYALDVEVDFQGKFVSFYDDDEDKESRLIYSFPQDKILNENELRKEILKDSKEEE